MRAEGEWTQAGAPAVLARAQDYIAAGQLDLSGITRADSASIALLLELTRRARAAGKSLQFTQLPPQMVTLLEFFGIDDMLPAPLPAKGTST